MFYTKDEARSKWIPRNEIETSYLIRMAHLLDFLFILAVTKSLKIGKIFSVKIFWFPVKLSRNGKGKNGSVNKNS